MPKFKKPGMTHRKPHIAYPDGGLGGLETLRILFKEILQGIPPNEAERLAEGYRRGENIVLVIHESAFGKDKKTAFAWKLTKD